MPFPVCRTEVLWRRDIETILRGVVAAYLAGAHPRDALIMARFAMAVAAAFDVHLDLGAATAAASIELLPGQTDRLLRGRG